jgi:hypothetical protein
MLYAILIHDDEKQLATIPQAEIDKVIAEYRAFTADLRASGKLVTSQRLQPTTSATTVRVRNGKTLTTDGPFAETKEQLGGFYLIEADDLNAAIQVAARVPSARFGSIEVRPIHPMSPDAHAKPAAREAVAAR